MERKRAHQLLLNATGAKLFPSKKQTVDPSICKPESMITMSNAFPWDNSAEFQTMPSLPNPFVDRLFGTEINKPVNLTDRTTNLGADGSNVGKRVSNGQFENDLSVGLSISYAMENSGTSGSYGEIGKPTMDRFHEPANELHLFADNDISSSRDPAYSRGTANTFLSMEQVYSKDTENITLIDHSHDLGDADIRPAGSTFEKSIDNAISITSSRKKLDSNTITFSGYQGESIIDILSRPFSSYSLLYEQSAGHQSEKASKTDVDVLLETSTLISSETATNSPESMKNKLPKKSSWKEPPNSFPSNVRSLLATGILDGVTVRYVSTKREEHRGTIKGSGYLCGCQLCNYSKALNAYEFERHAGSKTKHPNNHIYFENGKTIYQIVQELKNTPENMLFDAVQTITGSAINQKAFRIWKESFQAATRELQRIYGKDELNK